ncbi:MAG: hypothetical protein EAX90_07630 [Candidatus Heimdallarchaeota archaeon]|nr:hypothetical protein [Candidatus Heimdallarchaeota archaeon]
MSIQQEYVLPFVLISKEQQIPIESELAYVVGVVGDKIKKGSFFKKSKERLTQVSKFYWRIFIDTFERRLILVDSLGLYGAGAGIQDLSLAKIEAHIQSIYDSSSLNAYANSLMEANGSLVLTTNTYPVFDEDFTKSTIQLAKNQIITSGIDSPLILPSFENSVNEDFVHSIGEINRLREIQEILRDLANKWLGEVHDSISVIENEYASKITYVQQDADNKIVSYEERMNEAITSDLQKANQAIYRFLTRFEASTAGLSGVISPLQEESRKITQNLPSTDSPKFQQAIEAFLERTKKQLVDVSTKVKDLENERKQLEKALNSIAQTHLNTKQKISEDYENNKDKALTDVDDMRMRRDKALSTLVDQRDTIKQVTDELCKKIEEVIKNRKHLANTATLNQGGNLPTNLLISSYLVKFQEKENTRYFVIPPLTKTRGKADYPNAEMDSAIAGGKTATDKLAAELVFNRRLKSSFDALRATNYIATGEFAGAVRQGLSYLVENKMMGNKTAKRISDQLIELGFN